MIPYGKQDICKNDIELVSKALKNKYITGGKYKNILEKNFCKYLNVNYAASCNSGTSALQLAIESFDLKKNDTVVMPAINFVAAYNICNKIGVKIFLADVDPITGQMTEKTFNECVINYKLKKVKLIITMYLGGYPGEIQKFYKIKKKYNSFLLEDACHALGAKYKIKNEIYNIGSCKHSDICVFSLHPLKTITSGEGGIVATNNKRLYETINRLRSHGIVRDKKFHWKYDVIDSGFNYRLSDINCALAISQLNKINKFVKKRSIIFNSYKKFFYKNENFFYMNNVNNKNLPAYHLFIVSLKDNVLKCGKNKLFTYMLKNKIFVQYHYIPIYNFKIYNKKVNKKFYSGAEYFYKRSFSLPIFYKLNNNQINHILTMLVNFVKKNSVEKNTLSKKISA